MVRRRICFFFREYRKDDVPTPDDAIGLDTRGEHYNNIDEEEYVDSSSADGVSVMRTEIDNAPSSTDSSDEEDPTTTTTTTRHTTRGTMGDWTSEKEVIGEKHGVPAAGDTILCALTPWRSGTDGGSIRTGHINFAYFKESFPNNNIDGTNQVPKGVRPQDATVALRASSGEWAKDDPEIWHRVHSNTSTELQSIVFGDLPLPPQAYAASKTGKPIPPVRSILRKPKREMNIQFQRSPEPAILSREKTHEYLVAERGYRERFDAKHKALLEMHGVQLMQFTHLCQIFANWPRPTELKIWFKGIIKAVQEEFTNASWYDKGLLLQQLNNLSKACRALTANEQREARAEHKKRLITDGKLEEHEKLEMTKGLKRAGLWKITIPIKEEDEELLGRIKLTYENITHTQKAIITLLGQVGLYSTQELRRHFRNQVEKAEIEVAQAVERYTEARREEEEATLRQEIQQQARALANTWTHPIKKGTEPHQPPTRGNAQELEAAMLTNYRRAREQAETQGKEAIEDLKILLTQGGGQGIDPNLWWETSITSPNRPTITPIVEGRQGTRSEIRRHARELKRMVTLVGDVNNSTISEHSKTGVDAWNESRWERWTLMKLEFELESLSKPTTEHEARWSPSDLYNRGGHSGKDTPTEEKAQNPTPAPTSTVHSYGCCQRCSTPLNASDFIITHTIDNRGRSVLSGLGCHGCGHRLANQEELEKITERIFGIDIPRRGRGRDHNLRKLRWTRRPQQGARALVDRVGQVGQVGTIGHTARHEEYDEAIVNTINGGETGGPRQFTIDTTESNTNDNKVLAMIEVLVETDESDQLTGYEKLKVVLQMDRGASCNCVAEETIERLGIRRHKLKRPLRVHGVGKVQHCEDYARLRIGISGKDVTTSQPEYPEGRITVLSDFVVVKGLGLPLLLGASTLKACNVIHSNEGDWSIIGCREWRIQLHLEHIDWRQHQAKGTQSCPACAKTITTRGEEEKPETRETGEPTKEQDTKPTMTALIRLLDEKVAMTKGRAEPASKGTNIDTSLEAIPQTMVNMSAKMQACLDAVQKRIQQLLSEPKERVISTTQMYEGIPIAHVNVGLERNMDQERVLATIMYLKWGQTTLQMTYDALEVVDQGPNHPHFTALVEEIIAYNIDNRPMSLRRQQFHRFHDTFQQWLTKGGPTPTKPKHISPEHQVIIDEWNTATDDNIDGLGEEYTGNLKYSHIDKPSYIPLEVWEAIEGEQKPYVAERWDRYPEERRKFILQDIEKIDICGDRPRQHRFVRAMVYANIDAFYHVDDNDAPLIPNLEMRIITKSDEPIVSRRNQRFSPVEQIFLDVKCRLLARAQKIEESCSPYRAHLWLLRFTCKVHM